MIPPEVLAKEGDVALAARKAKKMIGDGWVEKQKQHGYSGLSVRDLADSFKLLEYYMKVYKNQSNIVHGTNALAYFKMKEGLELNLGPNSNGIDSALFMATAHMAGTMDVFNRRLGLEFDADIHTIMTYLRDKAKTF